MKGIKSHIYSSSTYEMTSKDKPTYPPGQQLQEINLSKDGCTVNG